MDMRLFGANISRLRKAQDLTQSRLAELLNVTRQAVSKWEMGDSFPDISLLPLLSETLQVPIEQLIRAGLRDKQESKLMRHLAEGDEETAVSMLDRNEVSVDSIVRIAPVLKASTLDYILQALGKHGIDVKHLVQLAVYMNEAGLANLLKQATFDGLDIAMLERLVPFLDQETMGVLLERIINGMLDESLLVAMVPYLDDSKHNLICAAVLEGQLDHTILKALHALHNE